MCYNAKKGGIEMGNRNVVSFLNMKGGVCKTTLCKEIALFLSEKFEKNVLVIDIDPQSNCTQSFFERFNIIDTENDEMLTDKRDIQSIEKIFSPSRGLLEKPSLDKIILKLTDKLHIIPGELHTIFMERETGTGAAEQRLVNFIEENEIKEKYDYVFIDCPPTYSFYTIAALLASDFYLVPLVPDAYSLLGFNLLTEVTDAIVSAYKSNFKSKPLNNLGIIFTKIPPSTRSKTMGRNMEQIREAVDGVDIFENYFIRMDKIITAPLSKFIFDRQDIDLIQNLEHICQEFIEKVACKNEEFSS